MSNSWLEGWDVGEIVSEGEYAKSMGAFYDSTLGAPAASFDITSVPTWGSHLLIELYLRGDTAAVATGITVRFNNDSGANYSYQTINGAAGTPGALESIDTSGIRVGRAPAATAPASSFGVCSFHANNFRGAVGHKAAIGTSASRENTGTGTMLVETAGGAWFATPAAITRVTVSPAAGSWDTGSRCTAYVIGP